MCVWRYLISRYILYGMYFEEVNEIKKRIYWEPLKENRTSIMIINKKNKDSFGYQDLIENIISFEIIEEIIPYRNFSKEEGVLRLQ